MTDNEILQGCKRENLKAQQALYDKYSRAMMGICLRYIKNQTEAEDLFQDGFVKVFNSIRTLENPEALPFWIRRVFINTCINFINRNKKYAFSQIQDFEFKSTYHTDEPLNTEEILKALGQLPESYQLIFNLFVVEGYSHKEISELLGFSEGTSKSQLSRAKAMLRTIILKTEKV